MVPYSESSSASYAEKLARIIISRAELVEGTGHGLFRMFGYILHAIVCGMPRNVQVREECNRVIVT